MSKRKRKAKSDSSSDVSLAGEDSPCRDRKRKRRQIGVEEAGDQKGQIKSKSKQDVVYPELRDRDTGIPSPEHTPPERTPENTPYFAENGSRACGGIYSEDEDGKGTSRCGTHDVGGNEYKRHLNVNSDRDIPSAASSLNPLHTGFRLRGPACGPAALNSTESPQNKRPKTARRPARTGPGSGRRQP